METKELQSDLDCYKRLAAKYLKERDYFKGLYEATKTEAEGLWQCLEEERKKIKDLRQQRDNLRKIGKEIIENEPFGITPYWDEALRKLETEIADA